MEINIWQVLFQIVNFGVILFVLNKVLYKPILKLLDDRAKKINDGMALADKNIKAAEETEKTKKEEIAKARKEAAAIIRDAESDAKKAAALVMENAQAKAKAEAERIVKNAQADVASSKKSMEAQTVELAVAMAHKVLESTLTSADSQKITKVMLTKLR